MTEFYTEASRKYAEEDVMPAFFRNGVAREISYQFIKKNGAVLDMLVSATAELDAAGIPAEYLARIFAPSFTTKKKGSGLGLATSYSIIENHGGLVRVRSESAGGAPSSSIFPRPRPFVRRRRVRRSPRRRERGGFWSWTTKR